MYSLRGIIGTPSLWKLALGDLRATKNFCLDRSSWKDEKTIKGNGNDSDQDKDTSNENKNIAPKDNFGTTENEIKPISSIQNFEIYKKMPKDIDELFLKRNERFRYRKINEVYKKEMDQIFLKEKDTMKANQKELDSNKLSPVAFKKNTIFDEKLDNMVKNLLSETKSVITKMARLRPPSTSDGRVSPVTFEKVKTKAIMANEANKDDACDIPTESTGSGESSGSPGQSGGSNGHKPPGSASSDVIVSPYVDEKGNVDYTRAVVKSASRGDASAADIIKRLIVDPVKPLPTFEIPNTLRQSETIVIRGDGSLESKIQNIPHVNQTIFEQKPNMAKTDSSNCDTTKTKENKSAMKRVEKCKEKSLETDLKPKGVTKCDQVNEKASSQRDCKSKSNEQKRLPSSGHEKEKIPSQIKQDCTSKRKETKGDQIKEKVSSDYKSKNIEQKRQPLIDQEKEKVPSQIKQDCKSKSKETKGDQIKEKVSSDCKSKNIEQKRQPLIGHDKEKVPSQMKQDCKSKSREPKTETRCDQLKAKVWKSQEKNTEPNERSQRCGQGKEKVSSPPRHDFKSQPKVFQTRCNHRKSPKSDGEGPKTPEHLDTQGSRPGGKPDEPPKNKPEGQCG